jgi:EpsD family peptidyl-prolyl cis-trans isomerase
MLGVLAVLLTSACGDPYRAERITQPAAKVDGDEITVQQVEHLLQQQRGLRPEQADAAARVILERQIDQQLAAEQATGMKIDRDPKVQLQLELARREILARAYLDRVGAAATPPTPDEIRQYYEDHPELFGARRIFVLQELAIEAAPEQVPHLRQALTEAASAGEYVEWLRANGYKFAATQAVRPAEQLPRAALKALVALDDGQHLFNPVPTGAQVIVLAGSRAQPVTPDQARPAIEQFLLNERRRALAQEDLKSLRAKARIEYAGKFAESPPPVDAALRADDGVGQAASEPGR